MARCRVCEATIKGHRKSRQVIEGYCTHCFGRRLNVEEAGNAALAAGEQMFKASSRGEFCFIAPIHPSVVWPRMVVDGFDFQTMTYLEPYVYVVTVVNTPETIAYVWRCGLPANPLRWYPLSDIGGREFALIEVRPLMGVNEEEIMEGVVAIVDDLKRIDAVAML